MDSWPKTLVPSASNRSTPEVDLSVDSPAKNCSTKSDFALDLDAAAELDDAIGRQLEEVTGVGRDLRQGDEQLLLPARQQRTACHDEAVAAYEVGGAHRVDRDAALGERQQVAWHVGLLHEAIAQQDMVHALAEMADLGASIGRHVRLVGHLDGDQHDMLVQHLVVLEVVQQAARRVAREGGEIDRGALRAMDARGVDAGEQGFHRQRAFLLALRDGHAALVPGPHRREDHRRQSERHPAALDEFHHVRRQQRAVDDHEGAEHQDRQWPAPFPRAQRQHEHQQRRHQHGAGDGDAVGGGEVGRRLEGQHQRDHAGELDPVDRRHIDLAVLAGRGVQDLDARAQAQQRRLLRHREGAGDRRLRGDHRRHGRQHHQRIERPARPEAEERIFQGRDVGQQQRALAVVVDEQRGQHEAEPGPTDRARPEMAHVGIERFGAGDRERDGAEGREGDEAVAPAELDRLERRQRQQDARRLHDLDQAQHHDGDEPEAHDRAEPAADAAGAEMLDGEQRDDDGERDRHDQRLESGRGDVEALDGAQHRDRRRQQAVAVEQRGAGHAEHDVELAPADRDLGAARDQRHQRQHAAFAAIVGAHHDQHVLQRDDDDQRPGDQRQDAEHVIGDRLQPGELAETFLDRVERAGADVAEHHA